MSEAQAIETDDEIIIDPVIVEETALAAEEAEIEEVEIVVEGEEQPASKPVHKNGLQKRFGKMKGKIDAATTEADEANRRAQMLEEENKLLRLQAQQVKPVTRPDEDDFDTRKEYLNALDEYEDAKIDARAEARAKQLFEANQTQTVQSQVEGNLEKQIDQHYDRSASLKVPDYSEVEAVAADILGDDISRQIIANTDESHLLMYHLGKNPAKAENLKSLLLNQPMKGVLEIGRLAGSLKVKPKNSIAPDPETKINGGNAIADSGGSNGVKFE
jgi:hypothetical protein